MFIVFSSHKLNAICPCGSSCTWHFLSCRECCFKFDSSDALWPMNHLTNHVQTRMRVTCWVFSPLHKAWMRKQDSTSPSNTPHQSTIANGFKPPSDAGLPFLTNTLLMAAVCNSAAAATFVSFCEFWLAEPVGKQKNLSIVWTLCCSSTLKPAREKSSNV